ncbi:MAG: ATP-binding cassette domain-containing protein [Candidatus Dormibacteraeota bacterium]|uniref:ATP-binding cassette domain-containing protein n=1 Tax=Candidatus Dormiibacter inghamiae TaxID=3127013 RepID=A0A934K8Z2_9BACT|nr:ATP-binding cassette domain-containing protein [Candidatus Dormibacteraeota bacterium]MBJ7607094.1 ATP-binding cassette domain-containing protein [Candidatus Dormibacteraeota bacterium]
MSEPAIELVEMTKRFRNFTAVDRLSLTVQRGEIFGLLGPNGSGKTTTVNVISGLSRPTSGTVRVLGRDMLTEPRSVRRLLGTIPQETALYEELSAEANLRFHGDLFDVPRSRLPSRIDELLRLVQLEDRRRDRVSTYSGGMKRRLALARALLHDPELLYLDEPTLGVDVQSRRAIWDHVLDLRTRGKTVLITTNYLEEASALGDRLAIIDRGRLVALDSPQQLKSKYGDTVLDLVLEPAPSPALLVRLRSIDGVTAVNTADGTLKVNLTGDPEATGRVVTAVTGEAKLLRINQHEPDLDEVFLQLTGRELRD